MFGCGMGPSQDELNGGNLQPPIEGVDVLSPRKKLKSSRLLVPLIFSKLNDPFVIPSAEDDYEPDISNFSCSHIHLGNTSNFRGLWSSVGSDGVWNERRSFYRPSSPHTPGEDSTGKLGCSARFPEPKQAPSPTQEIEPSPQSEPEAASKEMVFLLPLLPIGKFISAPEFYPPSLPKQNFEV
nr:hypothetical protein Iba_chr09fCG9570 [Ipomoea batatas]